MYVFTFETCFKTNNIKTVLFLKINHKLIIVSFTILYVHLLLFVVVKLYVRGCVYVCVCVHAILLYLISYENKK